MPVIGLVTRDFVHEDSVAIPKGSKLFGAVSFDEGGDRAKVDWRSIQLPDGRERPLSAVGVSIDGQVGVAGKVHSDAVKNTVGQTLTCFIGAYSTPDWDCRFGSGGISGLVTGFTLPLGFDLHIIYILIA